MEYVKILQLNKINDPRGNLTFLQNEDQIPFPIKRVFWTYDVPGGEIRGGHAYKMQKEVIIALSGSFDVVVKVQGEEQKHHLNRSYYGLYLPRLTWRHIENFSTNALSLHISSTQFNAKDYVRDFTEYQTLCENER